MINPSNQDGFGDKTPLAPYQIGLAAAEIGMAASLLSSLELSDKQVYEP